VTTNLEGSQISEELTVIKGLIFLSCGQFFVIWLVVDISSLPVVNSFSTCSLVPYSLRNISTILFFVDFVFVNNSINVAEHGGGNAEGDRKR